MQTTAAWPSCEIKSGLSGLLLHPPYVCRNYLVGGNVQRLTRIQLCKRSLAKDAKRLSAAFNCNAHSPQGLATAQQLAPTDLTISIYIAAVPLEGWDRAEQLLGERYPEQLALHTLVMIRTSDGDVTAFDFLPRHPTSIATSVSFLAELWRESLAPDACATSHAGGVGWSDPRSRGILRQWRPLSPSKQSGTASCS